MPNNEQITPQARPRVRPARVPTASAPEGAVPSGAGGRAADVVQLARELPTAAGTPLAIADLTTEFNDEPRIYDLLLAERLGFTDTHKVRTLIGRHWGELEAFGPVFKQWTRAPGGQGGFRHAGGNPAAAPNGGLLHGGANPSEPDRGGRPATEFFLNEGQALTICALSRTPAAARIRHELIAVFMAARRGALQPAPAAPGVDPALVSAMCDGLAAVRADLAKVHRESLDARSHNAALAAGLIELRAGLGELRGVVGAADANASHSRAELHALAEDQVRMLADGLVMLDSRMPGWTPGWLFGGEPLHVDPIWPAPRAAGQGPAPVPAPASAVAVPTPRPAPSAPRVAPRPAPAVGPGALLYGVDAIAAFLGITHRQAKHLIARGRLPVSRAGRRLFSTPDALRAWLDRTTAKPAGVRP